MVVFNNIIAGASGATSGAAAGYEITRSLRFDSSSSSYLNRTPSSAGNRKTWTWSGWVKRTAMGSDKFIFSAGADPANMHYLRFQSNNTLEATEKVGDVVQSSLITSAVYQDPSAWMHIVYVYDSTQSTAGNRLSLYVNGVKVTAFGTSTYPSQNHDSYINSTSNHFINARPNPAAYSDFYLTEIQLLDGTAVSDASDFGEYDNNNVWQPKEYSGSYGTNGFYLKFADNSSAAALGTDSSGNGNTWTVNNLSVGGVTYSADANYTSDASYLLDKTAPFNGTTPNAVINESTGAITNSNSRGVWSNTARTYIRWDAPTPIPITSGVDFYGGAYNDAAEVATLEIGYTDGTTTTGTFTSSTQSYMGRLSGVSSGKSLDYVKVSCDNACFTAIRVNGSFLDDLPASVNDSLIDTPTNYTAASGNNGGNYATLNPLSKGSTITLSNGNLDASASSSSNDLSIGTMGVSSGKYYWETTFNSGTSVWAAGIIKTSVSGTNYSNLSTDNSYAFNNTSTKYNGQTGTSYGSNYSAGDVIGTAVDLDGGTITFYINGSSQGTAFTGLSGTFAPLILLNTSSVSINFGQRPFAYTPPTGYKSLCTTNLTDPTIADGSTVMDVALYTGNDGVNPIALDFSADFMWLKCRDTSGTAHAQFDTIRGADKRLKSSSAGAETTSTTTVTSTASGFEINGSAGSINGNGKAFVAWTWDAGTSTTSNTDGSITSSVRANASAGFSIVKYTAAGTASTIGHSLNAAPEMIFVKRTDANASWSVYHASTGNTKVFELNGTGAASTSSTAWNSTTPTSSVFSIGNYPDTGDNGGTYIAYCFAPVEGYSAFGSYTGNGLADGPFVYTGMRPAFIMIKRTDSTGDWSIHDTTRDPENDSTLRLYPNLTNAEADSAGHSLDILSNGFKVRANTAGHNTSGGTYIYAAFAEHPFKTARAR